MVQGGEGAAPQSPTPGTSHGNPPRDLPGKHPGAKRKLSTCSRAQEGGVEGLSLIHISEPTRLALI
eukprot:1788053-Alexandrium_andersonii.AAC.1